MKKQKKLSKLLIAILLFSILAMYGYTPNTQAASIIDARDLLSDSDLSVLAKHTIRFTTTLPLVENDKILVLYPSGFGAQTAGNLTCPTNSNGSIANASTTLCTVTAAGIAAGQQTIIASSTNPSTAGGYTIEIRTTDSSDVLKERAFVRVATIDDVIVTATVSATLQFNIDGLATSTVVNGVPTTGSSTATAIPFGTLDVAASSTMGQQLRVVTNATDGYVVTVEQDRELTSNGGANINSFNNSPNNTGSTTAGVWASPLGILDQYHTYGHMGLTSDDSNLDADGTGNGSGGFVDPAGNFNDFTGSKYVGLNATNTMIVMAHTGPADGGTQDKGLAKVAYSIRISALQEAGDYTNTLTYICTPQY
jgi:hypothetical protein